MLLDYIVSKVRIAMDPAKGKAILEAPNLNNAKALSHFLGKIECHRLMTPYLAEFVRPLHFTKRTLRGRMKRINILMH